MLIYLIVFLLLLAGLVIFTRPSPGAPAPSPSDRPGDAAWLALLSVLLGAVLVRAWIWHGQLWTLNGERDLWQAAPEGLVLALWLVGGYIALRRGRVWRWQQRQVLLVGLLLLVVVAGARAAFLGGVWADESGQAGRIGWELGAVALALLTVALASLRSALARRGRPVA